MRRTPGWLIVLSTVFLLTVATIVALSVMRPKPPIYAPSPLRPRPVGSTLASGRYTIDARGAEGWVFFDFSRASVVSDPGPLDWDIAVRRYRLVTNGGSRMSGRGGAKALDGVDFAELRSLPESGYVETEGALGEAPENAELDGWYRYGFLTHLLSPRPVAYAIRTADGRYAKLRMLSYYCPGADPGCLTFEYVYQGDGSRRVPSAAPEDPPRASSAPRPGT